MGNCCSGGKDETKKASAFQASTDSESLQVPDSSQYQSPASDGNDASAAASSLAQDSLSQQQLQQQQKESQQSQSTQQQQAQQQQQQGEAEQKALREEQNRLELIVQMAGRGMVSVRSTRGSTGYYDQGFAAALGQHLEQTTKFPDQLPIRLPPAPSKASSSKKNDKNSTASTSANTSNGTASSDSKDNNNNKQQSHVFQRLAQPQWDNICLSKKGVGVAGCDGENPNTYMDHAAVSFLDATVPKKERIFHGGVGPMVENLL